MVIEAVNRTPLCFPLNNNESKVSRIKQYYLMLEILSPWLILSIVIYDKMTSLFFLQLIFSNSHEVVDTVSWILPLLFLGRNQENQVVARISFHGYPSSETG